MLLMGEVGAPAPSLEVKLVDVPDMKYFASHLPNPQGEICVRGNSIAVEYYKQPKMSAEVFSGDGWMKTGDIGEFLPNGSISIIDRKKNLVK